MIQIERWVDIDSSDYNMLSDPKGGKRLIERGLACKALRADKDGRIYTNPLDGSVGIPLNDTLNGQTIGFRYPSKAAN